MSETDITVTDKLNDYRLMVDRCCGLKPPEKDTFCESFGCDNIRELLSIIKGKDVEIKVAEDKRGEEVLELALEIAVDERTANFAKILRQAYQERFGEQG